MLKIRLLNLPFAAYHLPSIGLTQIQGIVRKRFGNAVDLRICYANHDFTRYMGLDLYESIKGGAQHLTAGFGEWLFRREAFPDVADNQEEYFRRYYPGSDEITRRFRSSVLEKRAGLGRMLDRIIDRHALAEADVVGCTSMFFETNAAIALARRLKARNPRVITLLGGANCESPSGEELARHVDVLDFVFSGSALKSFPRFVENLLAGDAEANHRVHGVFSKRNCGLEDPADPTRRFLTVGPMGEPLNINEELDLDYGSFFRSLEETLPEWEIKAVLPFETSRGCWWGEHSHCTFCGLNKSTMNYNAMEPQRARRLIESLFPYSDRTSVFMCVDNILQRDYVDEVFPYLETPAANSIFYQLKANLTEREVETMSAARVKTITPGFESLATSTLQLMAKGVTAFHNLRVMKHCRMHDVFPGWNLLIGSPGEGEEVYEKYLGDLPLLVHLPPPQAVFNIKFNRYSPYFIQPEKHGLDLVPSDHYRMVFPFQEEVLEQVAYDFQDATADAEYRLAMARWINPLQEKVAYWRRRWYGAEELAPKLHLERRDGRAFVYDSRSGEAREEEIDDAVLWLLEKLESQKKLESLASSPEARGFDVEAQVRRLAERGWLFEEDGTFLSLVLPGDPPPMTFSTNGLGVVRRRRSGASQTGGPALVPTERRPRRVSKVGGPVRT